MACALTDAQLQLLRLAQLGDVPMPREQRSADYFGDVELLVMLGLMEPRGDSFALTTAGVRFLEHLSRTGQSGAPGR